MEIKKKLFLLIFALTAVAGAKAQNVAIKTNLLSDGFANVNAGIEVGIAKHWTLDLTGDYNGWDVNDHKWRHWLAQPEFRYWFCNRFSSHFLGIHAMGGLYNFANIENRVLFLGSDFSGLTHYRYQGWGVGGGIAYGYAWVLGKHWNLEAEIGVGYVYTHYDTFECDDCGRRISENQPHHYVGPTKAAINLVYLF